MKEVSVIGITQDRLNGMPIVVLANDEKKFAIPIWVGNWEAELLEMHLAGAVPPRPFPYDIVREMISSLNCSLERVVINDFDKGIYFAFLELKKPDNEIIKIDARPSDALNLAVRFDVPILVKDEVIEKVSPILLDSDSDDSPNWENLIEEIFE